MEDRDLNEITVKPRVSPKLDLHDTYNLVRFAGEEEGRPLSVAVTATSSTRSCLLVFKTPLLYERDPSSGSRHLCYRLPRRHPESLSYQVRTHPTRQDVLDQLLATELWIKPNECRFYQDKGHFLGSILGVHGIKLDLAQVKTVTDRSPPRSICKVQTFPGFADFLCRFIKSFSCRNRLSLHQTPRERCLFRLFYYSQSKDILPPPPSPPGLICFDLSLSVVIEIDAYNLVLARLHSD